MRNRNSIVLTILALSTPAIIDMSLDTLLGMADTLMISWMIGNSALSAAGFVNQIVFTLIFIFTSFNTGGTAMIARSYGENNYKKLNKAASEVVFINLIIGIVIMSLSILFQKQIFSIFHTTSEVSSFIHSYFKWIAPSILPMFLAFSFSAILRGSGNTKTPMFVTLSANLFNIAGNFILIQGLWFFPKLGIEGAAIATLTARWLSVVIYLFLLFDVRNKVCLQLKQMLPTREVFEPLFKISLPGAVEQTFIQASFVVINVIISTLDTSSEAAYRILVNLESMSFMPAVGISIAAATLTGKALGESDPEGAYATGKAATLLGVIWGLVMCSLFLVFINFWPRLFTNDLVVINTIIPVLVLSAFLQPFLNALLVMSGVLRGSGDTRTVMRLSLLRVWLINVPMAYIFIRLMNFDLRGAWYAELISYTLFCLIMFYKLSQKKWTEIKI
jgi:putative MATE family efflux protein